MAISGKITDITFVGIANGEQISNAIENEPNAIENFGEPTGIAELKNSLEISPENGREI